MTAGGRRASWAVIVAASLFIGGYLLKYGEASYLKSAPEAIPPPPAPVAAAAAPPAPVVPATQPAAPTPAPAPPTPAAAQPSLPAPPAPAPKQVAPPKPAAMKPPISDLKSQIPNIQAPPPPPSPPVETAPAPPAPSQEAPRIQWGQAEFDFGALYQNDKVTHDFVFRNTGTAALRLGKVTTSCGCTAAKPAQTVIPPGGSGTISITFDSAHMRDRIVKHIYVESNDPATPRSVLTIRARVKVEAELVPIGIYFGSVAIGQTIERPVYLRPVEVKSFHILAVKSQHPLVTVGKPEPAAAPQPAGTYQVLVRIGPGDRPMQINSRIVISTDLPHTREIILPVYGRIVEVNPTRVISPTP